MKHGVVFQPPGAGQMVAFQDLGVEQRWLDGTRGGVSAAVGLIRGGSMEHGVLFQPHGVKQAWLPLRLGWSKGDAMEHNEA